MRITKIETIHVGDYPNILFVGVHTDEGIVGWGDTFYATSSVAGYIHDFAAPMLIGHDPLAIELHWRRLYDLISFTAGKGAEIRGLSAIDVALWDIFGQAVGMPIWQMLGGGARDRIRTYNTCGGPAYGRPTRGGSTFGLTNGTGQYEDLIAFMTDAGSLAEDLLSEGITGMKIWPFDIAAHHPGTWDDWRNFGGGMFDRNLKSLGGQHIQNDDLKKGLEPFRKIREAVGDRMEIMAEGHGYWTINAAKKIAHALEEYEPAWLEDFISADDVGALAELRASTSIPILASEYLTSRSQYKALLEARACDIVMIDPTWAGGITESRKISTMADSWKRPVAFHDCAGPLTLYAGIHLSINATNAIYQETVRAYLRISYPNLVTDIPTIVDGHILAPTAPGLGCRPLPELRTREDATVRVSVAS